METEVKNVKYIDPEHRLALNRPFVFFDVETTGLKPEQDRVITLSATRIEPAGGPISEQIRGKMVNFKFDPGFPIPPEITKITGITPLDVFGCPSFKDDIESLKALFRDADLCAYNGQFDLNFMEAEFARCDLSFKEVLAEDFALVDPRAAFVLNFDGKHTLSDAVAYYLKKVLKDAHTSDGDVSGMIDVFFAQLHKHDLKGTPKEIEAETSGRFEDSRLRFAKGKDGKVRVMFGKHRGALLYNLITRPGNNQKGYFNWMKDNLDKATVAYLKGFEKKVFEYLQQNPMR
jgi:DNA polymerase III subunit epsilon